MIAIGLFTGFTHPNKALTGSCEIKPFSTSSSRSLSLWKLDGLGVAILHVRGILECERQQAHLLLLSIGGNID